MISVNSHRNKARAKAGVIVLFEVIYCTPPVFMLTVSNNLLTVSVETNMQQKSSFP